MVLLLSDENFNADIVRGLRRLGIKVDLESAQQAGLLSMDDPAVLEWAANANRVILTHDIRTIPKYAIERVCAGRRMPGVFAVPGRMPVGQAIENLQSGS